MQVDESYAVNVRLEACGERSKYAGFMLSKHRVNKR